MLMQLLPWAVWYKTCKVPKHNSKVPWGTVTGQAPVVPGVTDVDAELPVDPMADAGDELDLDIDAEIDDEEVDAEEEPVKTSLGRGRR